MPTFARNLSLAILLLLAFLTAAVGGLAWLQKETLRLQADAVAAKRAQFVKAIEMLQRDPQTWDETFQHDLGALLGGTVTLTQRRTSPPPRQLAPLESCHLTIRFPETTDGMPGSFSPRPPSAG